MTRRPGRTRPWKGPWKRPWKRPFARFIAPARAGRRALWAIALGTGLIYAGATLTGRLLFDAVAWEPLFLEESESLVFAVSAVLALAAIASAWLWTAIALKLLHRRGLCGLFGPEATGFLRGALIGAALTAAVGLALRGLDLAFGGGAYRAEPAFLYGIPLWLAAALLIPLQATAEEIVFRGYLMQSLAARCRHPAVWALAPSLAFGGLHYDPTLGADMASAYVVATTIFALSACWMTWRTGSLGVAVGAHVMNNWIALLVLGLADDPLTTLAIWRVDGVAPADIVLYAALEALCFAVLIETPPIRRFLRLPPFRRAPAQAGGAPVSQ